MLNYVEQIIGIMEWEKWLTFLTSWTGFKLFHASLSSLFWGCSRSLRLPFLETVTIVNIFWAPRICQGTKNCTDTNYLTFTAHLWGGCDFFLPFTDEEIQVGWLIVPQSEVWLIPSSFCCGGPAVRGARERWYCVLWSEPGFESWLLFTYFPL